MDKTYSHEDETKIYENWEKKGFFTPKINPKKKPFTIATPPPNVTGVLHLGHVTPMTTIDIYARWHRMKGTPTLIIPGTDHAAIAAQNVVEKKLKKEKNLTRHDLGKEKFLKEVWNFIKEHQPKIENQIKRIGVSADWTRKHFTLDDDLTEAVKTAFKKLKDDKLIYQGERLINWCIRCQTALSDLENIHKEVNTTLYYIDYGLLTVATTRPETMLGDTAVAVNPKDDRYKKLIGKTITLPIVNREIPIIADREIDPNFGTGAVKVTPAHDPLDFKIAERNNLPKIKVINEIGKILVDPFKGLKTKQAREEILKQLSIVKTEKLTHNVGHCERCDTVTEPLISKQWFVKMEDLAKDAIKAVKTGKIKFYPKRMEKIYFQWLENIEDWCISRQIWWGHPFPGSKDDTLDTWFSAALWPFSTLGWPKKTKDFNYFHPTSLMITAEDIIFFWISKMIMMGIYLTKDIPFETVYFNQLILDDKGNKMSKSKGNVLDPMLYVEKYGADAVRLSVTIGASPGGRQRLGEQKIKGARNFVNKLWNIGRFLEMREFEIPESKDYTLADKWILSKLQSHIESTNQNLEKYRISQAAQDLYDFAWHDLADWYLEISKNQEKSVAPIVFDTLIHLLHPFIPYVTEKLYNKDLVVSSWPKVDKKYSFPKEEKEFEETRENKTLKEWLSTGS